MKCSKLTIKIPGRRQALFLYLYCYFWTYFTLCFRVSVANFEQVNANWKFQKDWTLHSNIPKKIFILLKSESKYLRQDICCRFQKFRIIAHSHVDNIVIMVWISFFSTPMYLRRLASSWCLYCYFEHISLLVLVFLLLTLYMYLPVG